MIAAQAVRLGHALAEEVYPEEVTLLKRLAQIPAPTGHEDERATFVAQWLRDTGAPRVEVDDAKNVLCWVSEYADAPVELFSAHTDVVFDDRTPLPLREEGARLYCPGVGDDTANLVGLLMATRYLLAHPELVEGRSILMVANSCEEGLGNLRGTRAVYERLGADLRYGCYAGIFRSYQAALQQLNTVRTLGFREAVVTAFRDGRAEDLDTARQEAP